MGGFRLAAILLYLMVGIAALGDRAAVAALILATLLLAYILGRSSHPMPCTAAPADDSQAPPATAPPSSPSVPDYAVACAPVLDPTYLDDMRQWVGDQTLLTLLASAPESFMTELAAIRLAWEDGNAQGVRENAHRLKGAAGSIGCRRLADLAQAMQGIADDDLSALGRLRELETEVATAIAAAACWRPPAGAAPERPAPSA